MQVRDNIILMSLKNKNNSNIVVCCRAIGFGLKKNKSKLEKVLSGKMTSFDLAYALPASIREE